MSRTKRSITVLLSFLSITSFLGVSNPPAAQAAESIPELQWPAVEVGERPIGSTSLTGSATLACASYYDSRDLMTYNTSGQVVQQIDHTSQVDGIQNCITYPTVDKNGAVYGVPWGKDSRGDYRYGPNLLAYTGNTLKWKYPINCGTYTPAYVVGADGNIYAKTVSTSDGGVHLIGIAPELAPGETQPRKVMDVKIPNDCSIRIHAYKDGIMVRGQSSGNARYYSYGGKYLGQATIGDVWYERMNSSGQLFVYKYVGSNPRTFNVSMFDPRVGRVVWTTQASTLNADATGIDLFPLSNGGVLARIHEQRVDGGAPSPTEYVWKLVTLNAHGQKSEPVQLPNRDASGNALGEPQITPQVNGKVLVIRDVSYPTGDWGRSVGGIAIGIYDPVNRTWGYQEIMRGETQSPDGPYGYGVDSYAPVNGTVYLVVIKCNGAPGGCARKQQKLYPLKVPGAAIDYPRGAVLGADVAPQPAPKRYAALGDSFSSQQGVKPFDSWTDTETNKCHRSAYAYPRLVDKDPYQAPQLATFVACSGALTRHITGRWTDEDGINRDEPAQADALGPYVDYVTATIGGNDADFRKLIVKCLFVDCSDPAVNGPFFQFIANQLGPRLRSAYEAIATKAINAKVDILGYPQLLPPNIDGQSQCRQTDGWMWALDQLAQFAHNGDETATATIWAIGGQAELSSAEISQLIASGNVEFNAGEIATARLFAYRIDQKIADTVQALGNPKFRYVDPLAPGSPFIGHELCTTTPYFNGLDLVNVEYSFHPNIQGADAYRRLLLNAT